MSHFDSRVVQVFSDDLSLNQGEWFEQEVNYLALKHAGLDDVPKSAILLLAKLAANGPSDAQTLARESEMDLILVDDCLESLGEYKFVNKCATGFEASEMGTEVFRAIATQLIIRKRFEMKRRFDQLDLLYKKITTEWHK